MRTQIIPSGVRYHILQGPSPLSFRDFFSILENNTDFGRWYSETIASCDFKAFFWELPPVTVDTIEDEAEFVLISSASLAGLHPDPAPFESQFALHQSEDIVTFPNLGGDALLIVPAPVGAFEAYTHLAAFLRNAPGSQIESLWKVAAATVRENLSHVPKWLSTAGLGVSWLHLRLDSRPKYYRYAPYKIAA
ncbi:MAG: hypothetical protein OEQ14_17460 [Gammaproteobacteria bacterium]|nr:hypothetical protein [Gammaproteobacteria bacterium]